MFGEVGAFDVGQESILGVGEIDADVGGREEVASNLRIFYVRQI